MIGDKEHICKTEEEVRHAIKNKNREIYAYNDIEVSEKLGKKILDKRILVLGIDRKEKDVSIHEA